MAAATLSLASAATSCKVEGDDTYYDYSPNALVTIKPSDGGKTFVMQLDDETALRPTNVTSSPYGGKEVRALANCSGIDKAAGVAFVNWLDSIRTKKAVATLGTTKADVERFGEDPVEIINGWTTVVEDGYLTMRFRTLWGDANVSHDVNLIYGTNPDDPYEVTFRHNAHGDTSGSTGDGYVAFRLADLPDTDGKSVTLTLKWMSFSGEKSTTFQYRTRKQ